VSADETVADLLGQSADDLLGRHCPAKLVAGAEAAGWSPALWQRLDAAELTRVGVLEERGGAGGGLEEAAAVVWTAARHAAPVPLAETMLLGGPLLAEAGADPPPGPLSAGVLEGGRALVPFARCATALALLDGDSIVLLRQGEFEVELDQNLAGEPRDGVRPRPGAGERLRSPVDAAELRRRGALARAIQIAGALEAVLAQSVTYASERQQFGSPLNRFQAVQELLTVAAEETVAASAAVRAAIADPSPYLVAAAKARASEAAGAAAERAHQVHGAIGFTHEYRLHLHTRRLWSWREEYGNEAEWGRVLGEIVLRTGGTGLWRLVTAEGRG
jgi:acyl-CoA dehydrogenase